MVLFVKLIIDEMWKLSKMSLTICKSTVVTLKIYRVNVLTMLPS